MTNKDLFPPLLVPFNSRLKNKYVSMAKKCQKSCSRSRDSIQKIIRNSVWQEKANEKKIKYPLHFLSFFGFLCSYFYVVLSVCLFSVCCCCGKVFTVRCRSFCICFCVPLTQYPLSVFFPMGFKVHSRKQAVHTVGTFGKSFYSYDSHINEYLSQASKYQSAKPSYV